MTQQKDNHPAPPMDNMAVWNMVAAIPDDALTPIDGTELDTISAEYIKKRLTEIFGPVGIGWGREIMSGRLENGEYTVVSRMWIRPHVIYPELFSPSEISHFDEFGHAKPKDNELNKGDIAKRAATDALSRHARLLGLAWENFNVKRKLKNQTGQPTGPSTETLTQADPPANLATDSSGQQKPPATVTGTIPNGGTDPLVKFQPYQMSAERIEKWTPRVREIVKTIPPFTGMFGYWRILDDEMYVEIAFTKFTSAQQKVFESVGFSVRKTETSKALFNRYSLQAEERMPEAA